MIALKKINFIRNNLAHPKDKFEFVYPHTKMKNIEGKAVRVLDMNADFDFSLEITAKNGIDLFHRLLDLTSSVS